MSSPTYGDHCSYFKNLWHSPNCGERGAKHSLNKTLLVTRPMKTMKSQFGKRQTKAKQLSGTERQNEMGQIQTASSTCPNATKTAAWYQQMLVTNMCKTWNSILETANKIWILFWIRNLNTLGPVVTEKTTKILSELVFNCRFDMSPKHTQNLQETDDNGIYHYTCQKLRSISCRSRCAPSKSANFNSSISSTEKG